MAKNQKAKPVTKKGDRNSDRKNGKSWKKNPKQTKARRPGSENPWEMAKAARKTRRANDPEIQKRAKKYTQTAA